MARFIPLNQAQQAVPQPTGGRFIPYSGGSSPAAVATAEGPDPILGFLRQGAGTGRSLSSLFGGGTETGQTLGNVFGGVGGLTSLAIGAQTGNPYTTAGGALSTLGSGASLLGYPGAGQAIGALGGPLGLAGGIQALVSGGNPVMGGIQTGLGALQTYSALSSLFPNALPSITSSLSGLLGGGGAAAAGGAGAAGAGGAAAGSATGAAAGGAAGATGALVAAPVAAAVLGVMISNMLAAQRSQEQDVFRQTQFMHNLQPTLDDVGVMSRMLGDVEGVRGNAAATRALIAKMDLYGRNTEKVLKDLQIEGPSQMYGPGPSLYESLTPQLIQTSLGRLRASDELSRQTGQFEPGTDAAYWAKNLGSLRYNSSEAGSGAFNTAVNDWLNTHYPTHWVDDGYFTERQWTPEGQAALAQVRPGHIEEDLVRLFGGPEQTFGGYFAEPAYGGYKAGQSPERYQQVAAQQRQLLAALGLGTGRLPTGGS